MRKILILTMIVFFVLQSCSDDSSKEKTDDENLPDEDIVQTDADVEPVTSITFTKETDVVVADSYDFDSPYHTAFTDVVRLDNGKYMVVYRLGPNHFEQNDDNDDTKGRSGKIMYQLSDNGTKWNAPAVLIDDPLYDDRDPSIAVLSDGSIVLNHFKYYFETTRKLAHHHVFFNISNDNGTTFEDEVQVDPGSMEYDEQFLDEDGIWKEKDSSVMHIRASSGSIVEVGNKLIIPVYGDNPLNWNNFCKTPKSPITLWESTDSGKTWIMNSVEPEGDYSKITLQEPSLLALDENHFIMHVRTSKDTISSCSPSNKGYMMQTESFDGGKTWIPYTSFDFVGHAPELYRLSNGVLVSAFRWLSDDFTKTDTSFIYSLDEGKTWSERISVIDEANAETGYPGIVEMDNNKMLIVYYTPGAVGISASIYSFVAK